MSLPAPFTPPDCDIRDFPFMHLDVARLRDSDLATREDPEACWAAVLLWCAAWHQVPSGSLPDDDRVLASFAGYGRVVSAWLAVKGGAMRNFVKCSDGRLYHPVVAEKAFKAWLEKLAQRWRAECARIKKANQRHGTDDPSPTLAAFVARVPRDGWHVSRGALAAVPRNRCVHASGTKRGRGGVSRGTRGDFPGPSLGKRHPREREREIPKGSPPAG